MVPKHIVCATDLLGSGRHATDVALSLASAFGARLTLIHAADLEALETYSTSPGFSRIARDAMVRQLNERVATDRNALDAETIRCQTAGVETRLLLEDGRPWEAILRASKRDGADLVVVGNHPPTGAAARLLGNTADRIIRHAPCPVLVASGSEPASWTGARVLVGVDFSEHAGRALALAGAWAAALGGHVTAMHIAASPTATPLETGAEEEIEAAVRKSIHEHLEQWCAEHGVTAARQVAFGDPGDLLAEEAARSDIDLLVVGTRGQSRLSEILLGSTTERAVARAPVPIVAVR